MAISTCISTIGIDHQEIKEHGTPFFPIACYDDDLRQFPVAWHWHEEPEAVLVVQGCARIALGSRILHIPAGDGIFINSNTLHSAEAENGGECRLHSFVFHPRLVGGSMDSVFWHKYLNPILNHPGCPGIYLGQNVPWQKSALSAISDTWHACEQEYNGYEFAARDSLSQLILLIRRHLVNSDSVPSAKSLRDGIRIKQMLQLIHEQYASPLTIAQIAACASISESECMRCFRGTIGTTPMAYVKKYRLQKAADLIDSTDQKIQDIGEQCGFQEMSYFARAFRAAYGCTPTEYRQRLRHR